MALPPTITPEDQQKIADRKEQKQTEIQQANDSVVETQQKIADAESEEATNRKMFDYYHGVITSYEGEITPINGESITDPLTESDIVDRSNAEGRLYDVSQEEPDIIRIPQFDGGPTSVNPDNELARISQYDEPLNRLQNGLTTSNALTETTDQAVGPVAIDDIIDIEMVSASTFPPGAEVIIFGSGYGFIAEVNSSATTGECSDPLYTDQATCESNMETWTETYGLNVTVKTPISGTIASGGSVTGVWNGFTDAERNAKVSSVNVNLQTILDYYLSEIDANLTSQISFMNDQKTAIQGNQDNSLDPTALTNINTAISDYTTYQVTLDISDTGISYFTGLNSARTTQANDRLTAIVSAKGGYYDQRYSWAVERAGYTGTLVEIKGLQDGIATTNEQSARTQNSVDLYEDEF